jgi:hypothetical protein
MPVPNVAEGSHGVGKEHHAKSAESKIDGLGLEAMGSRVVQDKLHLGSAGCGNTLAGQSQLLIGYINPEYSAARPDCFGQPEHCRTRPAADVQDTLAAHRCCGGKCGLCHFSHKLIDARLFRYPAPGRLAVPECPLRHRHGFSVAHAPMPLGFRHSERPAEDGKCRACCGHVRASGIGAALRMTIVMASKTWVSLAPRTFASGGSTRYLSANGAEWCLPVIGMRQRS